MIEPLTTQELHLYNNKTFGKINKQYDGVKAILQPFYHTGCENFYQEQKCRFDFLEDNKRVDFKNMMWLNDEGEKHNGYYIHWRVLSNVLTKLNISHNFLIDTASDEYVLLSNIE